MFIALFTIAKTWKQLKSHQQTIDSRGCGGGGVYVCVCVYEIEHYSAIKKNEIMPFVATWMYLHNIILSEISQRQILYDITSMCNLKNNTNESMYKTEIGSQT